MIFWRLVLDTDVLVSALLFPAEAVSWLRDAWQAQVTVPLMSRDTTAELIRVLSYPKFQLTNDEREDLLADYLPWCETVSVSAPLTVPECHDPFDRPFLALALVGYADALVTGDEDLLVLAPLFSVPILTPDKLKGRVRYGPARPK